MVIVLFRSRLAEEAGDGYSQMAEEMVATARAMPGFVDVKTFRAEDGERLTVVWWQDQETMRAWREHPRHLVAQRLGKERFYSQFTVEVAELVRSSRFERPSPSAD
jgi:heme-degrading monooxygenase HmoA